MNLLRWFFRRRKVLVHCQDGDIVLPVRLGNIIEVPWIMTTCPFHLEPDGTVTLRLTYSGGVRAAGYGKVWDLITWEPYKE